MKQTRPCLSFVFFVHLKLLVFLFIMSIFQPSTPSKNRRAKHNVLSRPKLLVGTSFAVRLYRKCTDVLACTIHLDIISEVKYSLKQSLARLGSWEHGIESRHLENVLSESPDLGYAVVHFLKLLASLLSKGLALNS